MRIAICDKEKWVGAEMEQHILNLYPGITVCRLSDSEALFRGEETYDIIYMDLQMLEGDIAEKTEKLQKKQEHAMIIWMTEKEDPQFHTCDDRIQCLVKPFDKDKVRFFQVLRTAVEGAHRKGGKQNKKERTIVIKEGAETRHISYSEILYLEISNRKIMMHLRDGLVEFYGKLGDYERILGEEFYRTHRTYLIHLKYVKKYNTSCVTMENGEEVPLVKQKYDAFVESYEKYRKKQE